MLHRPSSNVLAANAPPRQLASRQSPKPPSPPPSPPPHPTPNPLPNPLRPNLLPPPQPTQREGSYQEPS